MFPSAGSLCTTRTRSHVVELLHKRLKEPWRNISPLISVCVTRRVLLQLRAIWTNTQILWYEKTEQRIAIQSFRMTTSISFPPLLVVLIFILFKRISLGQLCQMFLTLWECCLAFGFFKHSVDDWRGEHQGSDCCLLCTWLDLGLLTLHRPTFTLKHTVLHSLDGGDSCREPVCSRYLQLLCTYSNNVAGCREDGMKSVW